MAYFSNGEEGMYYEAEFCERCVHGPCCPIIDLHQLWNYDACNGKRAQPESAEHVKYVALNSLIPRSEDGLTNEQCKLFVQKL